jgi:hypothetical protein
LVSVTVTDVIPCAFPVTLNDCTKENWLPKGADAALAYHVENRLVAGTVTELVCRPALAGAANVNVPCVTLRGVEKPITVTVRVLPVATAVTLVMLGAAAGITTVCWGAGDGVISCPTVVRSAVMVMVPATVPVWSAALATGAGLPAGI